MFNRNRNVVGRRWRLYATGAFALSLVVNALAGTTILGGNTTAQVSDSYPNLFAPAGVTFAIWGVIYLLLAGYCVRLFTHIGKKRSKEADILALSLAQDFTLISLLNTAWLLAWQYRVMWLSVIIIVAFLAMLAKVNLKTRHAKLSMPDRATIKLPFAVYFGWLTVATIANVCVWLVSINWSAWGIRPGVWMVIILGIGAVIGIITALRLKSAAYLAVFVWAYGGILVKHLSPSGHNGAYPSVIIMLAILIAVFVSVIVQLQAPKLMERMDKWA